MHSLIIALSITLFASIAGDATYDVGYGSLEAPDDFTFKHIGTTDSFMGTLTRNSDGFTISFDIGGMAGTHMVPSKRDKCAFFRTHTINGNFAWTGIHGDGKRTITTTIYDHGERSRRLDEEARAMFKLPPDQREQAARELNERRAQMPKDPPPPANFSADLVRESDLVDFLLIVATYRLKTP